MKEKTTRGYLMSRAKDLRRVGFDVPSVWFVERSEGDPVFIGLFNDWKRSGWVRRLAPSFFWEEQRWETFGQKVARINRARNPDSGVSLVNGLWRARLYADGRESHRGSFKSKEEALAVVRRARKTL